MTKKDYVVIAEAIRNVTARTDSDTFNPSFRDAVEDVVLHLTNRLKADNPRFRYDTFFKAAGLDEWGKWDS